MNTIASQITSLTIVYSTLYSGADQRKHKKFCVTGLCAGDSPGPVNSPHKWPVTRKMFPFHDVIMCRPNRRNIHIKRIIQFTTSQWQNRHVAVKAMKQRLLPPVHTLAIMGYDWNHEYHQTNMHVLNGNKKCRCILWTAKIQVVGHTQVLGDILSENSLCSLFENWLIVWKLV